MNLIQSQYIICISESTGLAYMSTASWIKLIHTHTHTHTHTHLVCLYACACIRLILGDVLYLCPILSLHNAHRLSTIAELAFQYPITQVPRLYRQRVSFRTLRFLSTTAIEEMVLFLSSHFVLSCVVAPIRGPPIVDSNQPDL
jgi:hypothetical protein